MSEEQSAESDQGAFGESVRSAHFVSKTVNKHVALLIKVKESHPKAYEAFLQTLAAVPSNAAYDSRVLRAVVGETELEDSFRGDHGTTEATYEYLEQYEPLEEEVGACNVDEGFVIPGEVCPLADDYLDDYEVYPIDTIDDLEQYAGRPAQVMGSNKIYIVISEAYFTEKTTQALRDEYKEALLTKLGGKSDQSIHAVMPQPENEEEVYKLLEKILKTIEKIELAGMYIVSSANLSIPPVYKDQFTTLFSAKKNKGGIITYPVNTKSPVANRTEKKKEERTIGADAVKKEGVPVDKKPAPTPAVKVTRGGSSCPSSSGGDPDSEVPQFITAWTEYHEAFGKKDDAGMAAALNSISMTNTFDATCSRLGFQVPKRSKNKPFNKEMLSRVQGLAGVGLTWLTESLTRYTSSIDPTVIVVALAAQSPHSMKMTTDGRLLEASGVAGRYRCLVDPSEN